MRRRLLIVFAVVAMTMAVVPMASAGGDHPGLTPESVSEVLFPGQSIDIEKTVHTPEIPPSVDVCLLSDETGSFDDDIANLQNPVTIAAIYDDVVAEAPDAQFAVAGFRDYELDPYGSPGDWVYQLYSPMSAAFADWSNGVNSLVAGGGNDGPEAQYDAIVGAAVGPTDYEPDSVGEQNDCGWRDDDTVTHVLVVTTDAPFHGPDGTHVNDHASTLAALDTEDIVVVGLKASGAGSELDDLASDTGGSVQALSSDGSNIADAILAGLEDIEIEVSMESDCAYPITTTFAPVSQVVTSGEDAVFTETIAVAGDAPGGTYDCADWATIDGAVMVDADERPILERKQIRVPEGFLTGGGQIGKGNTALSFGGNVGFLADFSVVGQWQFHDHSEKLIMHSTRIRTLQFWNDADGDPDPPPANANVGDFEGTARVKIGNGEWDDNCRFSAQVHDHSEPPLADEFGITIQCGVDTWDYMPSVNTDNGNLQIHSGLKD